MYIDICIHLFYVYTYSHYININPCNSIIYNQYPMIDWLAFPSAKKKRSHPILDQGHSHSYWDGCKIHQVISKNILRGHFWVSTCFNHLPVVVV